MKSILTKYTELCTICGRRTEAIHHLLFGTGIRELADEDGIVIPICNDCHNMGGGRRQLHDNSVAEMLSKICGQLAYEKHLVAQGYTEDDARERFRKRYGRSYL